MHHSQKILHIKRHFWKRNLYKLNFDTNIYIFTVVFLVPLKSSNEVQNHIIYELCYQFH
jgi:hypothetical protein